MLQQILLIECQITEKLQNCRKKLTSEQQNRVNLIFFSGNFYYIICIPQNGQRFSVGKKLNLYPYASNFLYAFQYPDISILKQGKARENITSRPTAMPDPHSLKTVWINLHLNLWNREEQKIYLLGRIWRLSPGRICLPLYSSVTLWCNGASAAGLQFLMKKWGPPHPGKTPGGCISRALLYPTMRQCGHLGTHTRRFNQTIIPTVAPDNTHVHFLVKSKYWMYFDNLKESRTGIRC